MSSWVTSFGSLPSRAALISPRASRSSGSMYSRPSRSYTSASVANCSTLPDSTSVIPCSETERPILTARSRSSTLCAAEPVKCWRRFPYASGATIRRSIETPFCVVILAPPCPGLPDAAASGCSTSAVASAFGSFAVAMMSTSLHVSARRRAEPATATASRGRVLAQVGRELLGDRQDVGEEHALGGPFRAELLELRGDVLLGLRPEALHRADALLGHRLAQVVDRGDADLVEEAARRLRAEAGDPRHLDQRRRELRLELLRRRDHAGVEERLDLLLGRLADPGQLRDLAGAGELGDRDRALAHRLGRVAVRVHAEAIRSVELIKRPELGECVGDLGVGRVLLSHSASSIVAWRPRLPILKDARPAPWRWARPRSGSSCRPTTRP